MTYVQRPHRNYNKFIASIDYMLVSFTTSSLAPHGSSVTMSNYFYSFPRAYLAQHLALRKHSIQVFEMNAFSEEI